MRRSTLLLFLLLGCTDPPAVSKGTPKAPAVAPIAEGAVGSQSRKDALHLVESKLVAPATARLRSVRLLEQRPPFFLYHVVLDAQNEFGAFIRYNLCAVVETISGSTKYKSSDRYGVQDCGNPPDESLLGTIKALNDWPEDRKPAPQATAQTEAR